LHKIKQTQKITISLTKPKSIAYKLRFLKKLPHPPFHMEIEGGAGKGLKTIIKEGIVITNLTKKPHPSSPLERMGGVIITINEVQWLCHLHQYVHEVQHLHLHFFASAMEQQKLHFFGLLSSKEFSPNPSQFNQHLPYMFPQPLHPLPLPLLHQQSHFEPIEPHP